MKARIMSYRYVPSSGARISTGNKGNSRPRNAFRGGNGTYLVAEPPKVIVFYEREDGEKGYGDACHYDFHLYILIGTGKILRLSSALTELTRSQSDG